MHSVASSQKQAEGKASRPTTPSSALGTSQKRAEGKASRPATPSSAVGESTPKRDRPATATPKSNVTQSPKIKRKVKIQDDDFNQVFSASTMRKKPEYMLEGREKLAECIQFPEKKL
eukprot:775987-Rhodomonas_salina.4